MKRGIVIIIIFIVFSFLTLLEKALYRRLGNSEHSSAKALRFLEKLLYSKCPVCKKHGVSGIKFDRFYTIAGKECRHCHNEIITYAPRHVAIGTVTAFLAAFVIEKLFPLFTGNDNIIYCAQGIAIWACYYLSSYFARVEEAEDYYARAENNITMTKKN